MSTELQKNLAPEIVKNATRKRPKTKQQMLEKVGYAPSVARAKANEILGSKGVLEELNNLGFDVESAKKVGKHILTHGKEENKVKIIQEIFKVTGEYAPEKHLSIVKKIIQIDE